MNIYAVYALMWLSAVVIALLPWGLRKLRGSRSEPRMTEANFLVKTRLHNSMVESQYMFPLMLLAATGYLVLGYQDGGWHKFLSGAFVGLAVAHTGRYRNSRQLVNLLKKEEALAAAPAGAE